MDDEEQIGSKPEISFVEKYRLLALIIFLIVVVTMFGKYLN
jgi:hypothetical protein